MVSAYRELESRGLLRGYVGRGTFVSAAPEPTGTPFAWRGKIAAAALRSSDATLRDAMRHSADARAAVARGGRAGARLLPDGRVSAARWTTCYARMRHARLASRTDRGAARAARARIAQPLRRCRAESVLVLAGAQQGLDLLARCLIDPGDAVVIDRPGYLGAIQSFRAAGAKLIGWDIARADIDELEDLLVRYRPKLIYTNPTFQNPTGATMPIRTRRELLSLAERYRVPIVEDATYRELYFNDAPPPSLTRSRRAEPRDSLEQLLEGAGAGPSSRLALCGAVRSSIRSRIIKQRLDPHTQNLVQFAMARLIRQGSFDAHLKTSAPSTPAAATRWSPPCSVISPPGVLRFARPHGGLYLWCRLAAGISSRALLDRALAAGVAFVAGDAFYPDPTGESELRLCFSSVMPATIDDAIRRLAGCLPASIERRQLRPIA